MTAKLNEQLHNYFSARRFGSIGDLDAFLDSGRVFRHRKRLYFDEVENANVWSFFLVERDLHHTFEEYIIARGLPPYAIWSKPERQNVNDGIGRATFPISETAALYRRPVPKAGDMLDYALEILSLSDTSAVLGFLGFLAEVNGKRSLQPSVACAWLRVFVKYEGAERRVATIPAKLRQVLEKDYTNVHGWTGDIA